MKNNRSEGPGSVASAFAKFVLILFFLPGLRVSAQTPAVNVSWLPITEAERSLKAPIVEKDAGVEALFWRVHVVDEILGQDL